MISIIAALGKNRVIGRGNELLWHIPNDLKRFKTLTLGHPVIMGRKTFDSILSSLKKPLPGRTNIVITRDPSPAARFHLAAETNSVLFANSLEDALEKAKTMSGSEEIFIIGGGQIYEQALPFVDRLYLTLVDDDKEGDAYFPPYETIFTKKLSDESRELNGLHYRWVTLEK